MTGVGRWRRCWAVLGVCCAGLVLAGCGGSRTISVDAGAEALRAAGFPHTFIDRHAENDTAVEGEVDTVDVVPILKSGFWPSARLIDYDSGRRAARRFRGGFTLATFKKNAQGCPACVKLPAGFAMKKVLDYRICNVILWSYNAHSDPRLTARVRRAARLLRASCH